jgi:hypothetical protein
MKEVLEGNVSTTRKRMRWKGSREGLGPQDVGKVFTIVKSYGPDLREFGPACNDENNACIAAGHGKMVCRYVF